jgi:hypothetical protein
MQPTTLLFGKPTDRADRLIAITGVRAEEWVAECSSDGGRQWVPATIYIGATVDEWRTCDTEVWNRAVLEGILPSGDQNCLWNVFFDVEVPIDKVGVQHVEPLFRFKAAESDEVALEHAFDLSDVHDVFVVDHRNVAQLAGGRLPEPWSLKQSQLKKRGTRSLFGKVESEKYDSEYPTSSVKNADFSPLTIRPGLEGWHRIYIGMEPVTSVRFSLSEEQVQIPVPCENEERLFREYCVAEADLTGRDIRLALGGTRVWPDASVHHIRFVPMTEEERARVQETPRLAEAKGRPFAGYVEPCTDGYYIGETIPLRDYIRNEMQLHQLRDCTEVYVHAIRVGFSAWYHSDLVERYLPHGEKFEQRDPAQLKWTEWMRQGDPMQVAVEEARRLGLKIFADMGMNITYMGTDRFHYRAMTARFAEKHPETMCPEQKNFFDYRHAPVQDYAVAIARELMSKYDVDGIHLDFARFACNKAFDEASLVSVVERIHYDRCVAQEKWGHPIRIAVRIPSYLYHHWEEYAGEYPEFVAALKVWAQNGWIERVMVCCMLPDKLPELSLRRYKEAIGGTKVELWGDLYTGVEGKSCSHFLDVARKWCGEGLDGGFFFYDAVQPIEFRQINRQLRLIGRA